MRPAGLLWLCAVCESALPLAAAERCSNDVRHAACRPPLTAIPADDANTTAINLAAVLAFYQKFPELRGRPLYLAGQSYAGAGPGGASACARMAGGCALAGAATCRTRVTGTARIVLHAGHYAPLLAEAIVEYNADAPKGQEQIPLAGYAVGNPWCALSLVLLPCAVPPRMSLPDRQRAACLDAGPTPPWTMRAPLRPGTETASSAGEPTTVRGGGGGRGKGEREGRESAPPPAWPTQPARVRLLQA